MSLWDVSIRPNKVPGRKADWPDDVIVMVRAGVLICTIYPVEELPGIQIHSRTLDFDKSLKIEGNPGIFFPAQVPVAR